MKVDESMDTNSSSVPLDEDKMDIDENGADETKQDEQKLNDATAATALSPNNWSNTEDNLHSPFPPPGRSLKPLCQDGASQDKESSTVTPENNAGGPAPFFSPALGGNCPIGVPIKTSPYHSQPNAMRLECHWPLSGSSPVFLTPYSPQNYHPQIQFKNDESMKQEKAIVVEDLTKMKKKPAKSQIAGHRNMVMKPSPVKNSKDLGRTLSTARNGENPVGRKVADKVDDESKEASKGVSPSKDGGAKVSTPIQKKSGDDTSAETKKEESSSPSQAAVDPKNAPKADVKMEPSSQEDAPKVHYIRSKHDKDEKIPIHYVGLPEPPRIVAEKGGKMREVKPVTETEHSRRARKNSQSRARSKKFKERLAEIEAKPENERTEEEVAELKMAHEKRMSKNHRSRQRSLEAKAILERILSKPEEERTEEEKKYLDISLQRRERKNLMDRQRRTRQKEAVLAKREAEEAKWRKERG